MNSVLNTSSCADGSVGAHTSMSELFSIGIGPSSSHTVGPMRAAASFVTGLRNAHLLARTSRIQVRLRGSLGATGVGHGSPDAVLAGLRGWSPRDCDPAAVHGLWERSRALHEISVGDHSVTVAYEDITLAPFDPHPDHPNALQFIAIANDGTVAEDRTFLSVGGGFVVTVGQTQSSPPQIPYPYRTFDDLLTLSASRELTIAEIAAANEWALGRDPQADAVEIWEAMRACIVAGRTRADGTLPGGLAVRRRAPGLARTLDSPPPHELTEISRIQLAALAVNEENASGFRVVTAPTNGAAGILPAVVEHYLRTPGADMNGVIDMLLTATAIGSVVKAGASISGAEVGCQGEVGSACAMAAGALCAALGGTPAQVGKAAEMGLEHHLGLTCDPVAGLVQIPCIERNAIAAVTAVQAATLTLNEKDQPHHVSLDTAIRTLRDVGADMHDKYKETSRGGLAVNVVEC
ncbi:L-serine ammonia-lyase [Rhodococcus baikonurensis]|uniref:L-serine ammonia-lyase n=1 Tax=Rhodococcus baikonurensis TaxID=172041 RepID=UPI0037AB47B9